MLDVGTGLMHSLVDVPCPVKLGLDAHQPYLEQRRVRDAVPIHASALDVKERFVRGAVDLVQLIVVMEHFELGDADNLLGQITRIAGRKTGRALHASGRASKEGFDATGLGGEELQRHRSTWEPEDLAVRGFRVI